jgi:hypothetical protein
VVARAADEGDDRVHEDPDPDHDRGLVRRTERRPDPRTDVELEDPDRGPGLDHEHDKSRARKEDRKMRKEGSGK